jgi:hypothetical protein
VIARYLKSTPPSEGPHGVFYPGEIEYVREHERRKIGIEIEDATWDKLRSLRPNTGSRVSWVLPRRPADREKSMTRQMAMVGFLVPVGNSSPDVLMV